MNTSGKCICSEEWHHITWLLKVSGDLLMDDEAQTISNDCVARTSIVNCSSLFASYESYYAIMKSESVRNGIRKQTGILCKINNQSCKDQ